MKARALTPCDTLFLAKAAKAEVRVPGSTCFQVSRTELEDWKGQVQVHGKENQEEIRHARRRSCDLDYEGAETRRVQHGLLTLRGVATLAVPLRSAAAWLSQLQSSLPHWSSSIYQGPESL
jgi:hypothetical protein